MSKLILILVFCAAAFGEAVNKSPVDLLREGRMMEAQRILEKSDAPERYYMLLDALREPNAIEACFLYREISARFPGTDCDVFAQERLLQAAEMGIDISALVLESAPVIDPLKMEDHGKADESSEYEVERPLNTEPTVKELAKSRSQETQADIVEAAPAAKQETLPVAMSTPLESEAKPKREPLLPSMTEEKLLAAETPKTEKKTVAPATESVTLDYSSVAPVKKDTGVVAASNPGEQLLVMEPKPEPAKKAEKKVQPKPEPTKPHDIDTISPEGWYIQVGAFGNHENAHKLAAKLRSDGYKVFLVPRDDLLQVRVGSFETKAQGREVGDEIKEKFKVPAVLVTVP